MTTAKSKFGSQRQKAAKRGVGWQLTFDEWMNWWEQTGHWEERGRCKGQYAMCRRGDMGPYSLDNIYCDLAESNAALPHINKVVSAETRIKMSQHQLNKEKKKIQGDKNGRARSVICAGVEFTTLKEAAVVLKCNICTIHARLNAKKYHYKETT